MKRKEVEMEARLDRLEKLAEGFSDRLRSLERQRHDLVSQLQADAQFYQDYPRRDICDQLAKLNGPDFQQARIVLVKALEDHYKHFRLWRERRDRDLWGEV